MLIVTYYVLQYLCFINCIRVTVTEIATVKDEYGGSYAFIGGTYLRSGELCFSRSELVLGYNWYQWYKYGDKQISRQRIFKHYRNM